MLLKLHFIDARPVFVQPYYYDREDKQMLVHNIVAPCTRHYQAVTVNEQRDAFGNFFIHLPEYDVRRNSFRSRHSVN